MYPNLIDPKFANNQPRKKREFSWLTFGVITLVLLCGGGLLAALTFGGFMAFFSGDPEGLQVKYNVSPNVRVGDNFSVEVALTDTGSKDITVNEIQLPNKILDGAVLKHAEPNFNSTSSYGDKTVYQYGLQLKPGESKKVIFQYKAIKSGDFSGSADILVGTRRKTDNGTLVFSGNQAGAAAQIEETLVPSPSPNPSPVSQ